MRATYVDSEFRQGARDGPMDDDDRCRARPNWTTSSGHDACNAVLRSPRHDIGKVTRGAISADLLFRFSIVGRPRWRLEPGDQRANTRGAGAASLARAVNAPIPGPPIAWRAEQIAAPDALPRRP
ncbi:hypothetical protein KXV85_006143, partial [Aspergillus fumigatus]